MKVIPETMQPAMTVNKQEAMDGSATSATAPALAPMITQAQPAAVVSYAPNQAPFPVVGQTPAYAQNDPDKNRLMTFGEKKFNWLTYGGYGLLANELLGLGINAITDEKTGYFKKQYNQFAGFCAKYGKDIPYIFSGRFSRVAVSIISGNFLVPPMKHNEDHKGEIVRRYDRAHYGALADTDPAIIAAHEEMDKEPKQSWGSLFKGRVITSVLAFVVDYTMGWKDAWTTKIFKENSFAHRFSSLHHIANECGDATVKIFNVGEKNQKSVKWAVDNGVWLLTLSGTLTAIFYVSSKLFAKFRDEKLEEHHKPAYEPKSMHHLAGSNADMVAGDMQVEVKPLQPESALPAPTGDKPQMKINQVVQAEVMQPSPQMAQQTAQMA